MKRAIHTFHAFAAPLRAMPKTHWSFLYGDACNDDIYRRL